MPLTPKNRKEEWLQGLVDHETTLTPKNRPEEWMKEIIDASGGGGGGGGGVLIANNVDGTLDKTWKELYDAHLSGTPCYISSHDDVNNMDLLQSILVFAKHPPIMYAIDTLNEQYNSMSENGYPSLVE